MWGVMANFFNKTTENVNTMTNMCKHIIFVSFFPTNSRVLSIPNEVICLDVHLVQATFKPVMVSGELGVTTCGVEFKLISNVQ